jgi:tryptophanyl-tRNA synthetase
VFVYLDAFDSDKEELIKLKEHYQKGGLGDVEVKLRLLKVLNEFLSPIREKRTKLAKDKESIMKMVLESTNKGREKAKKTLTQVKKAMKLDY